MTFCFGEYEVPDWLNEIVYRDEKKFNGSDFASRTYNIVVRRTIYLGMTTCCYFSPLRYESSRKLADIVHDYGEPLPTQTFTGILISNYNLRNCEHPDPRIEVGLGTDVSGGFLDSVLIEPEPTSNGGGFADRLSPVGALLYLCPTCVRPEFPST
ncbi:hypothetical protein APHAL10511_000016 [Amanita phalloides]|nr:hypothetical protein APHAL10511_000016 [Amanita phalloides]